MFQPSAPQPIYHNIITVIKVIQYVSAIRSTDEVSLFVVDAVRGYEVNECKIRLVYLEARYSLDKPEDHMIITSDWVLVPRVSSILAMEDKTRLRREN